jgi:adenylate kinase
MPLNLIILGAPGAGKGTQAERLAKDRRIPKISTGDILRDAVQNATPVGLRAKTNMDRGELVSDDVMIDIVKDRLERKDTAGGFILDGFPRTVPQAEALDRLMNGRAPLIVVDIDVPEGELLRRLGARLLCSRCGSNATTPAEAASLRCGRCSGPLIQRADDDEAVVRERLAVYKKKTLPLIQYYRSRPAFRSVNGAQTPDRVAADLARVVGEVADSVGALQ